MHEYRTAAASVIVLVVELPCLGCGPRSRRAVKTLSRNHIRKPLTRLGRLIWRVSVSNV